MPQTIETLTDRVADVGAMVDEVLATVATVRGPDLEADPRVRTDDRLRELLTGLERVRNAAEATAAQVMVAIAEEADRLDAAEYAATGLPSRSHGEFVPDEIGVLLACTKAAAGRRYGLALRVERYPQVLRAWSSGCIDERKVQTICDEIAVLDDQDVTADADAFAIHELTERLEVDGVDHARNHTWTQTREWMRRRVLAAVPEIAELRRCRAERERMVQVTPADDGMSHLWAVLPSVPAREFEQALTAAAQALGSDDPRTMDQRRADLMLDWLLGPDHAPVVHLHLVGGDSSVDASPATAWLPGVGQLTQAQTSELVLSARTVVTPAAADCACEPGYRPSAPLERAVRTRDVTCRFPGCRRNAIGTGTGTDVDHTVPWPAGITAADNLAVLCRRHHRLKHSPGWQVVLHANGSMTWTGPSGRTFTTHPWDLRDRPPTPVPRE